MISFLILIHFHTENKNKGGHVRYFDTLYQGGAKPYSSLMSGPYKFLPIFKASRFVNFNCLSSEIISFYFFFLFNFSSFFEWNFQFKTFQNILSLFEWFQILFRENVKIKKLALLKNRIAWVFAWA